MKRSTGGLVAALGGMGVLIAGFVIILKKGPLGGAAILLLMALLLFGVSILEALVNRKKKG